MNVCNACGRNPFKLIQNFLLIILEHLNIGEYTLALSSTIVNKIINGRTPVMSLDSWINLLLQGLQMVTKEISFVLVYHELNVVVITNYEHDTFSCDSELFLAGI